MPAHTPDILLKPAATLRVLHTADWHLGKMLGDLDRSDEHQRFLEWLLGEMVRQQVDVLLIAGDIFDTANPPQAAERQYFEFLAGVYRETKCSVVVTGGNHDSPTHLEAPRRVLRTLNVHVIGALQVFERRLELVANLPDREVNEMRAAFRELYQIHLDSDEGREAKAMTPETKTKTKAAEAEAEAPKAVAAVAAEAKVEELQFDFFGGGTPE
jgi:exonuclease SbcD